MPEYIAFPFNTEPEDLLQDAIAFIQSVFPGWQPRDGNLDTAMLESTAAIAAVAASVAAQVPDTIFRFFGSSLMGMQPLDATAATVHATVTAIDTAGHTVRAGMQATVAAPDGTRYPFYVQSDVSIPPGSATTGVGAVTLIAVNLGAPSSGLGGAGYVAQLYDVFDWVNAITLTGITTGGVDAELDDAYLTRLRTRLQLMTPRPILPRDFAVLALDIAGVFRSVAIDGYNPGGGGTFSNPRTISVVSIDSAGEAVSAGVKSNIDTYLQALREVNFLVYEVDPTYSTIDVTVQVKALPGYDPVDVQTRVQAALNLYLSPAQWGILPNSDSKSWANLTTVRYLEIGQIVNAVDGVDYITTTSGNYDLTMRVSPAAFARLDIVLTGVAPLPRPGAITVTVV